MKTRRSAAARLTPRAARDMRRIWSWIARDSGEARANGVTDELFLIMDRLAELPAMGPARPEFGSDIRCFTRNPYLVFYRPIGEHVQIVRVIDGRRDLPTAWLEDRPSR